MDEGAWLNIQSSRSGSLSHLMALFRKCVSHETEKMDRLASISACLQISSMMTIHRNERVHQHTTTHLQPAKRKIKSTVRLSQTPPCNDCYKHTLSVCGIFRKWLTLVVIIIQKYLLYSLFIHSAFKIANSILYSCKSEGISLPRIHQWPSSAAAKY